METYLICFHCKVNLVQGRLVSRNRLIIIRENQIDEFVLTIEDKMSLKAIVMKLFTYLFCFLWIWNSAWSICLSQSFAMTQSFAFPLIKNDCDVGISPIRQFALMLKSVSNLFLGHINLEVKEWINRRNMLWIWAYLVTWSNASHAQTND